MKSPERPYPGSIRAILNRRTGNIYPNTFEGAAQLITDVNSSTLANRFPILGSKIQTTERRKKT